MYFIMNLAIIKAGVCSDEKGRLLQTALMIHLIRISAFYQKEHTL